MKKLNTIRKIVISSLLLIGIALSSFAQDWTADNSNLYYLGSSGKVFMEADYDAMAIYFENDLVSEQVRQNFTQKFSRLKSASNDFDIMDRKGMIRIKKAESLNPIKTPEQRQAFLESYNLDKDGAYTVLPAFWIGDKQAWMTKQVIIRLVEGTTLNDVSSTLEKYGAKFIKNVTNSATFLLRVERIQNQLPLIHELYSQGVLVWGEPDFKVDLVKSYDPMYTSSWHLNNTGGTLDGKALVPDIDVDAPEAWAITTGDPDVVVAVIDDGVEAHEDMPTLLPGYTPVNGGNGTPSLAGDGHGQQVAGLISAQHNNLGAMGIAPGVNTFSVNIFAPNTTNTDVAEGITWAVNHGADILSNSWGFGSCTYNVAAITDAFANAANNGRGGLGCIILVASGNDFQTCVSYPANLPTVTAVGGISGDGERSMYSNYGPALDIVAPSDDDWRKRGRDYYSTGTHGLRTIDREGSNGWYSGNYSESFGGTSGATPQVSAVAALVLSVNSSLTKAEVENILYSSATDMGDENQYGAGIVKAHAAVLAAAGGGGGDTEAPTVPTNLTSSDITTTSFTLSWTASTDNVGVVSYDVYQNSQVIGATANTIYNVGGLNQATTYTYSVKAKDAAGNVSPASSSLNVTTLAGNTAPVADAGGPYTGDEGTAISFDGSGSSDADGDPLSYSWDFGDGSSGTGVAPTHVYASAGSYTARLTVSDGTDSDQATASVTVNSTGIDEAMTSTILMIKILRGTNAQAEATITVMSNGNPVANAVVNITWSGDVSGTDSGSTASNGTVTFSSDKIKNGNSITITINGITAAGYFWDETNSDITAILSLKSGFISGSTSGVTAVEVYPNPVVYGIINLRIPDVNNDVRAIIYDISGRVEIQRDLNDTYTQISVGNLKSGIYILRIEGLGELVTQKIIIN